VSVALVVEILGDASKLSSTLEGAKGDVGGLGGMLGGSTLKMAALAGGATLAAGAIIEMTAAAAADRDEQNKLTAAIAAATGSTADYTAEIDAAIAAGQDRAFTDSDTRDALQSLVTATGDVTAATGLLTQTQDIARLAGVDLATAADAVAKAQAGQDGPLRKLIPGLEKGATATDTLAAATAKAAGQADLYAKSSAGMGARASDAFGELGETIGEVFLPVLDALLPIVLQLLRLLGQLIKAVLPAILPILKLVAGALTIVGNVLAVVVGWIVKLVQWIGDAIGALGRFLDAINPLKGVSLPSLPFLSASSSTAGGSAGTGRAASRAAPAGSSSGPTVNVYTTGDSIDAELAVTRALRRVTRLNGGVVPAVGWTGN
jgi:hypothetical protein